MDDVYHLSSYILPKFISLKRNYPRRSVDWDAEARKDYDSRTLVYDAFFDPRRHQIRMFMPPLLNFKKQFLRSNFQVNTEFAAPKNLVHAEHFAQLDLAAPEGADKLTVRSWAFGDVPLKLHAVDTASFKNRKVIYTLQKDKPLDWIKDWMAFHHHARGADAVLIANNNSAAYSNGDLLEAMKSVNGFNICKVLTVPLPFGPIGKGVARGRYLEPALLNIVRDRFFQEAYAVLNVAIDELMVPCEKGSVFDSAQRHGYVSIAGRRVFAKTSAGSVRHLDHVHTKPDAAPCPPKYCYKPNRFLGRLPLAVHRHSGFWGRLLSKAFRNQTDLLYLHCDQISSLARPNPTMQNPDPLHYDAKIGQILTGIFAHRQGEAR